MDFTELHDRLMTDAQQYDAGSHARGILTPFRDIILLQRAKFMSYELIAITLARHGLKISAPAVGVFCRRNFTKAEIERTRQTLRAGLKEAGRGPSSMAPAPVAPPLGGSAPGPSPSSNGRRGPRIARDNY